MLEEAWKMWRTTTNA